MPSLAARSFIEILPPPARAPLDSIKVHTRRHAVTLAPRHDDTPQLVTHAAHRRPAAKPALASPLREIREHELGINNGPNLGNAHSRSIEPSTRLHLAHLLLSLLAGADMNAAAWPRNVDHPGALPQVLLVAHQILLQFPKHRGGNTPRGRDLRTRTKSSARRAAWVALGDREARQSAWRRVLAAQSGSRAWVS